MKSLEVNCTISSGQSQQKCTDQDFGCLDPMLCLICHTEAFLYFLHKETLLQGWISACSMRKTKGSFQNERGADRPEAHIFHQLPSVPRIIPARSLHLQLLLLFLFFLIPLQAQKQLGHQKKKMQAANMQLHEILLVEKQFYKKLWHIGLGEVLPSPFRAPLTATSDLCTTSFSE